MWPVGLPTSVMMAAMRSMTSTRRAEGWRPTTTAPGGNAADIFIVEEVVDPAGGHAPHRPDAVVEDGRHHGFRDGGPLLFGKGRGADPQGPGLEDDEVARLPHGPLDILGLAEMVLQFQGDFRQGPDLVVGEAGGLGLLRRQGNFLHSPGRAAGEGHGFFGHPALGDGVGVLPAHL